MQITAITTQYDQDEDRILLSVADAQTNTRKLWLSRRLLQRFIPALLEGLEDQIHSPR